MVSEWKKNNPEKVKAQLKRYRKKYKTQIKEQKRKAYVERSAKDPNLSKKIWAKLDKAKAKARQMAKAIKIEGFCQECKVNPAQERHHPDYSKPLCVIFLCISCHRTIDALKLKEEIKNLTSQSQPSMVDAVGHNVRKSTDNYVSNTNRVESPDTQGPESLNSE